MRAWWLPRLDTFKLPNGLFRLRGECVHDVARTVEQPRKKPVWLRCHQPRATIPQNLTFARTSRLEPPLSHCLDLSASISDEPFVTIESTTDAMLDGRWTIVVKEYRDWADEEREALKDIENLPEQATGVIARRVVGWEIACSVVRADIPKWMVFGPELEGDVRPLKNGGSFQPAAAICRFGASSHFPHPDFQDRLFKTEDGRWVFSVRNSDSGDTDWLECTMPEAKAWFDREIAKGCCYADITGPNTRWENEFTNNPLCPDAGATSHASIAAIELDRGATKLSVTISDLSELTRQEDNACVEPQTIKNKRATKKFSHGLPMAISRRGREPLFDYEETLIWWRTASFEFELPPMREAQRLLAKVR